MLTTTLWLLIQFAGLTPSFLIGLPNGLSVHITYNLHNLQTDGEGLSNKDLTLSRPREMANFSKSLTMNWETTCDIPFKRYFLGCAINHTNRDGGGHILEWKTSKTKEEKHWKFSHLLYILGIPLNYSLMYSSQCIACCKISTGPLTYKEKKIQKFEGW